MEKEKSGLNGQMIKWDFCSGNPKEGESQAEGYLHHDVNPEIEGLDLVCNLLNIEAHIKPNSIDEARLSHCLEHFTIPESKLILKILFKLLKTDGKLIIIVPNFKWHAQLVLQGNEDQANYYCFGGQLDEFDIHKQGWTKNRLIKALQEAGFALLSCDDESSITCVSVKP